MNCRRIRSFCIALSTALALPFLHSCDPPPPPGSEASAGIGSVSGPAAVDRAEASFRDQLKNTGVHVLRSGSRITLILPAEITFDSDRAQVRRDFYPILYTIVDTLKRYNTLLIEVGGHTDSTASREYNYDLSRRRGYSVSDILRDQGIREGRLQVRAYGPDRPIASNRTEAGRQRNRRVELALRPVGAL